MSKTVRRTGGRTELNTYANMLRGMSYRLLHGSSVSVAVANGTTAGNLRTTVASVHKVAGITAAPVVSTDDYWDLSAEVDTGAAQYRAYWLYSDGTFIASPNAESAADALAGLPALDDTLAIFGVYVAGLATDFDDAGGLAAQGTITNGVADGAAGVIVDSDITLVAP